MYAVAVNVQGLITASARAIGSLAPAVSNLDKLEAERADAARAIERGHFKPDEELKLRAWFARYLTARAGLLETIDDLAPLAYCNTDEVDEESQLKCFVIAYTAACLLVRAGRTLVGDFATHKLVQRKLNEADARYRIPRKQYTRVYRSLTAPSTAWRLAEAMRFADGHRKAIDALAGEEVMKPVLGYLNESEESLRVGLRKYLKARLLYRWHSWRRRRATAIQQGFFRIAEAFGRVIADVRNPFHEDRLTARYRDELASLLEPGDVIIARHDEALSNLFLPGYWPHAALHVGLPATRERLGIQVDDERARRWVDPLRVLEGRKDGVLLRAIDDTLAVDAAAIIRPQLASPDVTEAISRGLSHEGKLYNFDFDFFTDEKLVCTEVVYRAYEGVGGIEFKLTQRSGRPTLSAEDILTLAAENRGFEPVALFGTPGIGNRVVTGPAAIDAMRASLDQGDS